MLAQITLAAILSHGAGSTKVVHPVNVAAIRNTERPAIPFTFVDDGLIVVPVSLNGHAGYKFLLDTGASHSIVSGETATQLRIPIDSTATLATMDGKIPITVRTLDVFQMGPVRLRRASIAVADWEMLRTLRVDGILGADYLRQFKLSIDYVHKLITIDPA